MISHDVERAQGACCQGLVVRFKFTSLYVGTNDVMHAWRRYIPRPTVVESLELTQWSEVKHTARLR